MFKNSRCSNPDPRVEILKHIAYGNQGAIYLFKSRPWIIFNEDTIILFMENGRKSFSLWFDIGLNMLIHIFKSSGLSNPDPRVEILKLIAYESQGAIYLFKPRPWNLEVENIIMESGRITLQKKQYIEETHNIYNVDKTRTYNIKNNRSTGGHYYTKQQHITNRITINISKDIMHNNEHVLNS